MFANRNEQESGQILNLLFKADANKKMKIIFLKQFTYGS